MKIYAYMNSATGEYPLFEGDLRLLFPDMGDVFVCPSGYAGVYDVQPPKHPTEEHMLVELPPVYDGERLVRNFTFEQHAPPPPEPPPPSVFPQRPRLRRPAGTAAIFPTEATGRIEVTRLGPNT